MADLVQLTQVMGIVNVTPDSFSDGGRWNSSDAAIAHGVDLFSQGATIVDVGGESTRPGAQRVDADEEAKRVIPVVKALAKHGSISVDTMRHEVAAEAIDAGAAIINDVSGGLSDPEILRVVADAGVDYICQHWRGYGDEMGANAIYNDPVTEIADELAARVDAALAAGIAYEHIVIDPGLGFAKDAEHDWALVAHLDRFQQMGLRVLIGASRKRFLGAVVDLPADQRDTATAAISLWCQLHGIWAVRTHEVPSQIQLIKIAARLQAAGVHL